MFRFISIYRKNIKNSSINRIGKRRDFLSLSILRHKNHPAKVWEKFDYAILRKFFSFLWMDLLFELLIHNRKIVQVSLETKFYISGLIKEKYHLKFVLNYRTTKTKILHMRTEDCRLEKKNNLSCFCTDSYPFI